MALGKNWTLADAAAAIRAGMLTGTGRGFGQRPPQQASAAPKATRKLRRGETYDNVPPEPPDSDGDPPSGDRYYRDDRGIWYERNERDEWERVPQWLQEQLEGVSAEPSSPLRGKHAYDPRTGLVSPYPFESPIGSKYVEGQGALNIYVDPSSGLLYDREGRLPVTLQEMLGAGGGDGGGGGSPYAGLYADLAVRQQQEAERQNAFDRMLNYVVAVENAKAVRFQQEAERAQQLAQIAPYLAAGFEHYGGFGPTGGYTLMERLQTGRPVSPRAINVMPVNVPEPPPPSTVAQEYLGPLLGLEA